MRRTLATLVVILVVLSACSSPFSSPKTVYDLLAEPDQYNGKRVTVLGTYLWKPGNPGLSVLVPGVSTTDAGTDAQPIGDAVWLNNFPADATAALHLPGDAVYGIVEVTGTFESGGSYGADGAIKYALNVTSARAVEKVERIRKTTPDELPEDAVSLSALLADPGRYNGQVVKTLGYYFWSPGTAGLLAGGVEAEVLPAGTDPQAAAAGLNPRPLDPKIAMDGFPPEMSASLHVGPNNSFVWGLVEVTGRFETGGNWGPDGSLTNHLQIEQVKPLDDER